MMNLILVILALIALSFQINSWSMQRISHKKEVRRDGKSDEEKHTSSVTFAVFTLLIVLIALVALVFQIHSWSMQFDEYEKKRDGAKRSEQMDSVYLAFQNKSLLIPEIEPDFISEKMNNFYMEIHTPIGGKFEDGLSTMICGYHPEEYVFSKTQEGKAILRTIEWRLDEVLKKNQNKGENNVEIIVEAIGSDDALPLKKKVYYDGLLGDTLRNIMYYRFNEPDIPLFKTFIKGETLITNSEIALLRAWDAVKYLDNKYKIKSKYIKIQTREFEQTGPEYRRLDLKITLKDRSRSAEKNEINFKNKLNNNE
jgi:hypothetical protein